MKTDETSKFAGSSTGSHHWAATLLSYIMRVGEYMNDHGLEKQNEIQLRGWGLGIKERAEEVNNYLQSSPDIDKELESLRKFKAYVHTRLDAMGVPADPEPENNAKHGCRIEGRLNYVEERLGDKRQPVKHIVA